MRNTFSLSGALGIVLSFAGCALSTVPDAPEEFPDASGVQAAAASDIEVTDGPLTCAVLAPGSSCTSNSKPGECAGGSCCTGCVGPGGTCAPAGSECVVNGQPGRCEGGGCETGAPGAGADAPCEEGLPCVLSASALGVCVAGTCEAFDEAAIKACGVMGCNDGDPCTVDRCTSIGCQYYPAENGAACPGGVCQGASCCTGCVDAAGVCRQGIKPEACGFEGGACETCAQGNECLKDICVSGVGCATSFLGNTAPCGDDGGRCDWYGECCQGCFYFASPDAAPQCITTCPAGNACDPVTRVCHPN